MNADGPELDILEALWKSIKGAFRGSGCSRRTPEKTQSLASRMGSAFIIIGFLAILFGGAFALVALMRAQQFDLGSRVVKGFFFVGAGIGATIGLVYVARSWRSGDEL